MLFNSTQYALFLPIVLAAYFATPHRARWFLLLISSYYFYMCWKPGYVVLIMLSTVVDYGAGILMESTPNVKRKRLYLTLSLCSNLGMLFFFKYFNFFNETLGAIADAFNITVALPSTRFLLPVGLSFYTFQSLTYTIGVYRGELKAERHLGVFAAFVCFFPQLVAGPIERAKNLLPQFYKKHDFSYDDATDGLKLIMWGLFKKSVIADRLAQLVDQVYNAPHSNQGFALTVATVFFAIQIYCDFSGYSDMAVGSAQMLGYRLTENFRNPYHAVSITDFWRRWHISLSTWFRDYVYIPLGGNKTSKARWRINIMVVFILSGLWHGADWKFLAWGALHGAYMLIGDATSAIRSRCARLCGLTSLPRIHRALQIAITFTLASFAWIFFRANNSQDAIYIIRNLFTGWDVIFDPSRLAQTIFNLGLPKDEFILTLVMLAILEFGCILQSSGDVRRRLAQRPLPIRWAAYSTLLWIVFLFGVFRHKEFIYFTF
jgi:D-alanyl-lipoteichoic acid acyltransferase DltB (MBOAT superfamily)